MKISSANRIISIKVSNREDMTCYALYEDDDCNHSCDYDDYNPCGDDGNDFDCNQLMKT